MVNQWYAAEEINDRPNHVIINMNGTYAFAYALVVLVHMTR